MCKHWNVLPLSSRGRFLFCLSLLCGKRVKCNIILRSGCRGEQSCSLCGVWGERLYDGTIHGQVDCSITSCVPTKGSTDLVQLGEVEREKSTPRISHRWPFEYALDVPLAASATNFTARWCWRERLAEVPVQEALWTHFAVEGPRVGGQSARLRC